MKFDDAKHAEKNLRDAERRVGEAKLAFEFAIRRLYIDGASTREIARAFNLSHQRIHQLIGGRRNSWWHQAAGHSIPPVRGCSFCNRPAEMVEKLVAGPGVHICETCVAQALAGFNDADADQSAGFKRLPEKSQRRCSFCGQRRRDQPRISASRHQICQPCTVKADEIVREEALA